MPQYIATVKQFSAMEFKLSDNSNGTVQNATLGYQVTTTTGGIYGVNVTTSSSSGTVAFLFKVDTNNNTVLSATTSGQGYNYTVYGAQAKGYFTAFFGLFGLQFTYANDISLFTSSAFFHSTGSSVMTFGTTSFAVTTYVANTLPETINACGTNSLLSAYTLEVGTPPGTSLAFITYIHVAGTDYTNGTTTYDVLFQLESMTVA